MSRYRWVPLGVSLILASPMMCYLFLDWPHFAARYLQHEMLCAILGVVVPVLFVGAGITLCIPSKR